MLTPTVIITPVRVNELLSRESYITMCYFYIHSTFSLNINKSGNRKTLLYTIIILQSRELPTITIQTFITPTDVQINLEAKVLGQRPKLLDWYNNSYQFQQLNCNMSWSFAFLWLTSFMGKQRIWQFGFWSKFSPFQGILMRLTRFVDTRLRPGDWFYEKSTSG